MEMYINSLIFLIFVFIVKESKANLGCPDDACYYRPVVKPNVTWSYAWRWCRKEGGHLTSVRDWHTEWHIEDLVERIHRDSAPWVQRYSVWLGGRQNMTKSWHWASNHYWDDSTIGWASWAPSHPKFSNRLACAAAQADVSFQWVSRECWTPMWFLCERFVEEGDCIGSDEAYIDGICYHLSVSHHTWHEARKECYMNLQGDIATIPNARVMNGIKEIVKRLGVDNLEDFWIGATRTSWEWTDNGDPMMFNNWGTRYDTPNGDPFTYPTPAPSSCLQLHYTQHCDGVTTSDPCFYWMDSDCGNRASGFVCQLPGGASATTASITDGSGANPASETTETLTTSTTDADPGNGNDMAEQNKGRVLSPGVLGGIIAAVVLIVIVTVIVVVVTILRRRGATPSALDERAAFNNPSYTEKVTEVKIHGGMYSEANDVNGHIPRDNVNRPGQVAGSKPHTDNHYQELQRSTEDQEENIYAEIVPNDDMEGGTYIDFNTHT